MSTVSPANGTDVQGLGYSDRGLLLTERSHLLSDWTDEVLNEMGNESSGDPLAAEQLVGLVEMWSDWGDDALELLSLRGNVGSGVVEGP